MVTLACPEGVQTSVTKKADTYEERRFCTTFHRRTAVGLILYQIGRERLQPDSLHQLSDLSVLNSYPPHKYEYHGIYAPHACINKWEKNFHTTLWTDERNHRTSVYHNCRLVSNSRNIFFDTSDNLLRPLHTPGIPQSHQPIGNILT